METRTDEQLATAAASGDTSARNAFIARHMGLIYFHCRLVGGPEYEEFVGDAVEYICARLAVFTGKATAKVQAFNFLPHKLARIRHGRMSAIGLPDRHLETDEMKANAYKTRRVVSLDLKPRFDGMSTLASRIEARPEDVGKSIDANAARAWLESALSVLPERDRAILTWRMQGRTLAGIGKELGMSRERVRQLEAMAIETLREIVRI